MTDDARIERLSELARRVWPEHETHISTVRGAEVMEDRGDDLLIDIGQHPRALDALEAALLVLAGEPPAWVEQLVSEWAALAKECHNVPVNGGMVATASHLQGNMLERCARELRERASKP